MCKEGKEVVGRIQKNDTQEIRVVRQVFRGKDYIDARLYAVPEDSFNDPDKFEKAIPTRKGICLEPNIASEVAQVILKASEGE